MQRSIGVVVASVALALGCGDVAYDQAERAPAPNGEVAPTAGGEEGTATELSELLAEVLAPRICERVIGSFIGMPGEQGNEGPAAGLDPAVGRWWIRRCNAQVEQGRLRVTIAGSGWTWLDRETMGFRVRQYLRFDAESTFAASLHVGYDPRSRTATVWLRPAPGVTARVTPQGLVRAEATGIFSSMLGGILDITGSSANDRARQQAADEGSQRLAQKMQTGFTVTYALDTEQMDFMLGQLERGQRPERPWPQTEIPWLVNERSAVWPGGMDVLGPLPDDVGAMTLDVEMEEGQGADLRRVCADELARWLDAAWNGAQQGPPQGELVQELRQAHVPRSLRLEPMPCRSMIVMTPAPQASIPAMVRFRVTPIESGERAIAVQQAGTGPNGAPLAHGQTSSTVIQPATSSIRVRVEVRSASIAAQTPDGGDWDVMGGGPDPYVVVTSIPQRRELDRSPPQDDQRELRIERRLPGAVRLEDFPLRFVVYDEDVTSDELIGVADVEAAAVRQGTVELLLDLRSPGMSGGQTGTLRVRLQTVD